VIKHKAYKFRVYPTKEQEEYFAKCFGCVRFIYNKMLADKIDYYNQTKQTLNNTPAQYKEEFPWLKEVDSLALANSQLQLRTAYSNFFRDTKIGFPKFKSKKRDNNSYTTNNQANLIEIFDSDRYIKLPKVKRLRIKCHRKVTEHIKSVTITKEPTQKYYISLLVEYEKEQPNPNLSLENGIGLDYSSPHFYVDNQGNKGEYPKFYRQAQDKLAREQKKLSNMKYGSNNYAKQKIKVAKIHEHIANQRKDWLHKLSTRLANNYDYIFVEDLKMDAISKLLHLGKATSDNGFGIFRNYLKYKTEERGKLFVKIDKWFPSSKKCSFCGEINSGLTLQDREWTCSSCGKHHMRDINAAINIYNEGIKQITVGTAGVSLSIL